MAITERISYHGKSVGFRVYDDGTEFMTARKRYGFRDICPLCKKAISVNSITGVALIVSNQAGIPNRIIHIECMDLRSFEDVFQRVARSYEEAKQAMEQHGDWFPCRKDGDA